VGDSWCSMARIGWFDAKGRKRFATDADLEYFNSKILAPVQRDVIANTWMHERYGCDGLQQENRTMYYFEYPSFASMVLRETRYGIDIDLDAVSVIPFGAPSTFQYHVGSTDISYAQDRVSISVSGSGLYGYVVGGLAPSSVFAVSVDSAGCSVQFQAANVTTSAAGLAAFSGPRGCTVTLARI
jgi:hypothetical protein